jgi:hypothetical protein
MRATPNAIPPTFPAAGHRMNNRAMAAMDKPEAPKTMSTMPKICM